MLVFLWAPFLLCEISASPRPSTEFRTNSLLVSSNFFFPQYCGIMSTKQESKEKSQDQDTCSSFITNLTGKVINKHIHMWVQIKTDLLDILKVAQHILHLWIWISSLRYIDFNFRSPFTSIVFLAWEIHKSHQLHYIGCYLCFFLRFLDEKLSIPKAL